MDANVTLQQISANRQTYERNLAIGASACFVIAGVLSLSAYLGASKVKAVALSILLETGIVGAVIYQEIKTPKLELPASNSWEVSSANQSLLKFCPEACNSFKELNLTYTDYLTIQASYKKIEKRTELVDQLLFQSCAIPSLVLVTLSLSNATALLSRLAQGYRTWQGMVPVASAAFIEACVGALLEVARQGQQRVRLENYLGKSRILVEKPSHDQFCKLVEELREAELLNTSLYVEDASQLTWQGISNAREGVELKILTKKAPNDVKTEQFEGDWQIITGRCW